MLAILSTNTLSLLDAAVIKKAPSSIPSCLSLTEAPAASSWSPDNTFLFLTSTNKIHRYDPSSNSLLEIYAEAGSCAIRNVLSKDKSTLIYSVTTSIHVLECGSVPKISQTFETHKAEVTSLSLSNDSSLLASTSATAVHVHNLSLGSHTVLRGLTLAGQAINTCAFHPHSRTRLLLGVGKQLIVFDTTRPSGPMKTILLNDATTGYIIAVACSPFSKTLVAVATESGNVGLVDLDKEKGLFRTVNVKVPLTSLAFSPEGAAIYLGTENGKFLMLDLRALDRPPKTIIISPTGDRIETMSIQKKLKSSVDPSSKPTPASTTKSATQVEEKPSRRPLGQTQTYRSASKVAPSPARARVARVGSGASPARRVPSALKGTASAASPLTKHSARPDAKKKVFSPVRDPLGNSGSAGDISIQIESLSALRAATKTTPIKTDRKPSVSRPHPTPSPKTSAGPSSASATARSSKTSPSQKDVPHRARTVPTVPRTRKTSTADTTPGIKLSARRGDLLQPPEATNILRTRSRTASSASRTGSDNNSARSAASRPGSSASRIGSSPAPSTFPLPVSRTPSPDLPGISAGPVTPVPAAKGFGMLGVTPEVDLWIKAGREDFNDPDNRKGKGKGKMVGFKNDSESDDEEVRDALEKERERSLTMQVSPRRPGVSSSTSWAPSPLRHTVPGSPLGGGSAHDLLRTIVKDVMYDFQRETKAEMTGLHLDLVRMGRGWKKELRGLMDEYVGDLKDLREENRRLREENERLKRGY